MAAHVEVIFCDDIRLEVSNKTSFIGTYLADMVVESFPALLPKFCIHASVVCKGVVRIGQIRLRVMLDDACLIDTGVFSPEAELSNPDEVDVKSLAISSAFVLSPFQVEGPGKLRVLADVDGEELKSRALAISQGAVPKTF